MSRRRKPRRTTRSIAGAESLNLVCSEGTRGTHTVYRIAEVIVYPNPEPGATHLVRVRYVHPDDEHGEASDPSRFTGMPHFTRRFTCRAVGCDRYVPLMDDNLAAVVLKLSSLGVSRLELGALSGALR